MKKYTIFAILAIVLLASCQKERFEVQTPATSQEDVAIDYPTLTTAQKMNFDPILENFQKTAAAKARRQMCSSVTLFLDFEGENNVDAVPWGGTGTFNCPTSGLSESKKDSIMTMVREDFSPFIVTVTRNQAEFNSAAYPKMRMIITRKTARIMTIPRLASVPGVAFVNSMLWYDETPAFVFANDFTGSQKFKMIAEAVSHEFGHTFGLYHQGESDGSACGFLSEYRFASGDFLLSAIMGNPYQGRASRWIVGPSMQLPCGTLQNDAEVIASVAGYKNESFGSSFTGAPTLSTSWLSGVLVHVENQHAFKKNGAGTKVLKGKSNGNLNIVFLVSNSPTATTWTTYDDPNSLDATVTLTGVKYVKMVTTQPTDFALSPVGGSYNLRLQ